MRLGDFQAGDELEVDFGVECWLTPQQYTLTVATQNADGIEPRLAGRRHGVRRGGHARGGGGGQLEGAGAMARITVKVHPRARRSAVTGRLGDAWKLDLTAPPVEGKANEECVRCLAEAGGRAARAGAHCDGLDKPHQGCGD